ncbi:MAG: tetratricopeptide repeat protein [Bdellovibrionota bacterium]
MSLFWLLTAGTATAEIPSSLEPSYSEAVLAYNAKDYDRAVHLLRDLLTQSPDLPDFLEMQALAFKGLHSDSDAIAVYQKLLQIRKEAAAREVAPYHFELGSIYFKNKDYEKAQQEFETALQNDFNSGAAHFFLGMIAYPQKKWDATEGHLEKFRRNLIADLRPAASLYLAQAYSQSGYGLGATQNYFDALDSATKRLSDPGASPEAMSSAKAVLEASTQALAPVSRGQFFGDAGLLFGYDSNVLSLPNSVISPSQLSGKSSGEGTLVADIGYMTSALGAIQIIPSYRLRFNYGTNFNAAAGNFASNTLSLYFNRTPLDRVSYGAKIDGNLTFQDTVDPVTNAGTYRPFILTGGAGPYIKWQFDPYWALNSELIVQLQRNFGDADVFSSLWQSGQAYHAKIALQKTGGLRYLNPGFYLANDIVNAMGTQFKAEVPDVGLSNDLNFTDAIKLTLGTDLSIPCYVYAVPKRIDKTISASLSFSWNVWRKLTVLANASFADNFSNSSDNTKAYAYVRGTVSGGASWSIF